MSEEQETKNKGGRPLKFQTTDELDMAIQKYFDKQDPHVETHMVATGHTAKGETMFEDRKILTDQKPYTMAGLARALGVDRRTLLNYKKRDEFFPSILAAIERCEEYAESQLFGPYANGAKFSLINNYRGKHQDWADKHEVDHSSGNQPIPLLTGLAAPGTLVIEDEDDGGVASADDSTDQNQQS